MVRGDKGRTQENVFAKKKKKKKKIKITHKSKRPNHHLEVQAPTLYCQLQEINTKIIIVIIFKKLKEERQIS